MKKILAVLITAFVFGFTAEAKKIEKVKTIKPEKTQKVNQKRVLKTLELTEKKRKSASEEAEKMYESKFSVIDSKINYDDNVNIPHEVSLKDCIKLAIIHNPVIMSVISNSEIYKSRVGQAWANYFPTIGAGVSYSRNDMLMTMGGAMSKMIPQKYNLFYVPNISADMLLFDFGKTKAMADNAQKYYESSRYDAETSIELVIYNVKVAYYNLLFAKLQEKVYENTVQDYELQLKQAKAYYDIGEKAKIDVTFAEYNLGKAQLNLIKAKNTLELAAVELANAVGVPELAGVVLTDELNNKEYKVNFADLIDIAQKSRPSLLSAKKRMEASELTIRASKRAFTPNLSAFGSYQHGGREINSDSGYQVGVQLEYAGVNLMLLKKQVDEATASYTKAVADYEKEKQDLYLSVKSAYISLMNSYDSIRVAKLALQQAKEQQYQAFRRYQVGLGDAIEFKDSENTYLNAQLDYYSVLLNYNINAAEIERVIGAPIEESDKDL
ncbi:TolC family protein [bacterium]|nr:TolC family protein [bacterium]